MGEMRHTTTAKILGLYVYPVKSGRAIFRPRVRVEESGLEWFVTQRTHPRLALVTPAIGEEHLVLEQTGLPPLEVPLAPMGEAVQATRG